jgi:hypothetical protein
MKEVSMSHQVFLSYARTDQAAIPNVITSLRQQGVLSAPDLVFQDSNSIAVGTEFRTQIRRAIGAADTVVIYWTDDAAKSMSISYEAGMAEALGKRLILVRPAVNKIAPPSNLTDYSTVLLPAIPDSTTAH